MRRLVFGLLVLAVWSTAAAQPQPGLPAPRLQFVFPPGAPVGPPPEVHVLGLVLKLHTQLTVTGTDLEEPESLIFSHPGIKGTYIAPPVPPADPKKKDAAPTPASSGPHRFRITVDPAVPPGIYDVRFAGKWGVSNPRAFVVGTRPEVNEKEPNNDVPEAQRVELNTTINGVLAQGTDVDYSVFAGTKGQRVVISCLSTSVDGRANPMIEVFDPAGRKLAANRNYRDNDAVADLTLPVDGDYYVRLSHFTYQGGSPDWVYRLTIGTGPWIDAVFPPVVEPGKPATVTLYGRNLPNSQPADGFSVDGRPLEKLTVTLTPPTDPQALTRLTFRGRIDPVTALQDGFEYVFTGPTGASNPVPIYFTRDKLVVKQNFGITTAVNPEPIPTPCEVAGFLARRGEADWYSFTAKKGEQFIIEVLAERIGTEADFYFSVRDGKDPKRDLSGEQDDDPDTLHPFAFYTRSNDPPAYTFTAPEDGKFLVVVGCRESSVLYGPRIAYRLRISPARPDFRAVIMPFSRHLHTGSSAWQGGNQAYDVFVHRMDGYTGSIQVVAQGLPPGVTARPLMIGPGSKWGLLVLNVAADAPAFTGSFKVQATGSTPDGKQLVREVRPATVIWGVNIQQNQSPVLARLDQALFLAVRPHKAIFTIIPELDKATVTVNTKEEKLPVPLTVLQGSKLTVPVKVNWIFPDKQNVAITAEPIASNPQNSPVTVQIGTQPTKDKPEGVVTITVKNNALPGTYTINLKGVAQVPFVKDSAAKQKGGNVPVEVISEPIAVTVLPTALAKVTVGNLPNNTLKLGSTGELNVKVERQYGYAGEFKVKFTPPMGTTGLTAAEVTIPAGTDEAKLVLKAAADAKPGAVANAVVTVTGVYDQKHTITQETKVTFTVAK
jgi:hypothetical protein